MLSAWMWREGRERVKNRSQLLSHVIAIIKMVAVRMDVESNQDRMAKQGEINN